MQKEAPAGQTVKIRLILKPAWATVVARARRRARARARRQAGLPRERGVHLRPAARRAPRARPSASSPTDGSCSSRSTARQPGYSAGVTNFELALEMVKLGAVTAAALDGGGSAAMAFDGQLLEHSRPAPERPLADALLVSYAGVYAPPPLEPVLSPNGDGVAETPAARVQGRPPVEREREPARPRRRRALHVLRPAGAGHLPARLARRRGPTATPEPEGRWRWVVDRDRRPRPRPRPPSAPSSSTARSASRRRSRPRWPCRAPQPRAVAVFKLTRAATVTPRIKTTSGVVLRTLPRQQRRRRRPARSPGTAAPTPGALVYSGRYVAEVTATNELGAVDAGRGLPVRQPRRPQVTSRRE